MLIIPSESVEHFDHLIMVDVVNVQIIRASLIRESGRDPSFDPLFIFLSYPGLQQCVSVVS